MLIRDVFPLSRKRFKASFFPFQACSSSSTEEPDEHRFVINAKYFEVGIEAFILTAPRASSTRAANGLLSVKLAELRRLRYRVARLPHGGHRLYGEGKSYSRPKSSSWAARVFRALWVVLRGIPSRFLVSSPASKG
ncbi:hypothetical protein TNCT_718731 [Trichonephila clavata]|uniref:Uncharacterized protein n=1 Tax=Trichonephila clavata TaxID=2740835 RepID=A0A8X6IUY1_TRICU|nr:hypothetical protein TNCT_718731 [Trichonephila clavata]